MINGVKNYLPNGLNERFPAWMYPPVMPPKPKPQPPPVEPVPHTPRSGKVLEFLVFF